MGFTLDRAFSMAPKRWNKHGRGNEESSKTVLWQNKFPNFALKETRKTLQNPAAVAAVLGLLLLVYYPSPALASSGGVMGGDSISSSSSSTDYSSSSGYSSSSWTHYNDYSSYSAKNGSSSSSSGEQAGGELGFILLLIIVVILFVVLLNYCSPKISVVKLQVGLMGSARSLQRDLDLIAKSANTSTKEGLSFVLTETISTLLRHPEYCISAYSSVDVKNSIVRVKELFNKLSIEERRKFDEDTPVNVDNIKKRSSNGQTASGPNDDNDYIVVTILVAAEDLSRLPTINTSLDLKEALQKLASVPSSQTQAVQVLWTPQLEGDVLSKQDFLKDYPLLRPLIPLST
ncbi:OLC1v1000856C1 [Oldenlandia corymbosa var. corymbosa]|uniref:OLC1v1000856C1 n=1 Tax=Oldenlandia corymbosa var. corymbosa TaxID=529605 RepID=A0AAV1D3S2_OLDCO|nr:OLC1v1000856C1 [Oldenlandia corymbosa var. corymbosa]